MSLRLHIVVGSLALASSVEAAGTRIDHPLDDLNEHFAIATEHFGSGQVQLHSRRDGDDGSSHTVYSFNCVEQTYQTTFEGSEAPESFPLNPLDETMKPLTRETGVIPLAQHACAEHDHPLVELKW